MIYLLVNCSNRFASFTFVLVSSRRSLRYFIHGDLTTGRGGSRFLSFSPIWTLPIMHPSGGRRIGILTCANKDPRTCRGHQGANYAVHSCARHMHGVSGSETGVL